MGLNIHNNDTGLDLVLDEREHQIKKGYTTEDVDIKYNNKELLFAALAYLNSAIYGPGPGSEDWPFSSEFFHPRSDIENLTKAAALIIADIDRQLYLKR